MVNRGFCSSVGFKYELDCSCFRRDVQDSCLRYPGGHAGQMSPGRAEPSTSPPARPCAAPPRPARGMSGFWTRQVDWTGVSWRGRSKSCSIALPSCSSEPSSAFVVRGGSRGGGPETKGSIEGPGLYRRKGFYIMFYKQLFFFF